MDTLAVGKQGAAPAAAAAGRRRERLFYTGMAAVFVATVFAGFSRTYYLRPYFETRSLDTLLHLHGAVFTSWLVLLLAQTVLVAAGRTRQHRRLGVAGGLLAALMVVVGTVTAVVRAKVNNVPPVAPAPLVFLTTPLGDMLVFVTLVWAGFRFRRRTDVHKRLMLLATVVILPAAVARLPFDFIQQGGALPVFGLADLFVAACLLYDLYSRGRPHRATVLGGLLIVVTQPLRPLVGNTRVWLAFATWLTSWVG